MKSEFPRRTFLKLSAAAAAAIYLEEASSDLFAKNFSAVIESGLKNDPDFHSCVFSEAQTQELGGNRIKSIRSIQALAEIWRLSTQANSSDPETHKQLAKKIEAIITQGQQFDPETFNDFASFLAGGSLDAIRDAQTYGSYAGKIMETAGTILGFVPTPINKGAALALSLGGIWAEDVVVALAKPGLNLAFLPKTEPDRISLLNRMAYAKVLESYDDKDEFKALANDPQLNAVAGVDFGESVEDLVKKLPEQIRDIVESTVGADIDDIKASAAKTNELIETLSSQVSSKLDKLDKKTDEILTILKASENNKALQESYQRQLQYFKAEIQGAIVVGATILNAIFGNRAAQFFEVGCQAVITVSTALAQVAAGTMGPFGLASAFISAGKLVFGLFPSGPSEYEALQAHLDRIEERIIALGQYIDARFNQIEKRQIQTIELVSTVLREVLKGNEQAHDHFIEIEKRFNETSELFLYSTRADKLIEYSSAVSGCVDFLGKPSFPDLSVLENSNKYDGYLNAFYSYAVEVSRHPAFSAVMPSDATTFDERCAAISKLIKQYLKPELVFGILPEMCNMVGLNLNISDFDSSSPDKGQLRNPVEWARGAEHYLETRMHSLSTWANPDRVKTLWKQGLRLREAAITAGSCKALAHAAGKYGEAGFTKPLNGNQNFLNYLTYLVDEWTNGVDPHGLKNIQEFKYELSDGAPNKKVYRVSLNQQFLNTRILFEVDPVQLALDRGLIKKTLIKAEKYPESHLERNTYTYQLNVEVDEPNASLMKANLSREIIEEVYTQTNEIEVGVFSAADSLLQTCIQLFRESYEYEKVIAGLASFLGKELDNPNSTLDYFECAAQIAKVFSCLNALDSSRYFDAEAFLDVRNIPIIADRKEAAAWLTNYLFGDWYIRQADYSNLALLISKLQTAAKVAPAEPVAKYVMSTFSETLRIQIVSFSAPEVSDPLRVQITNELNQLLQDPNFYDPERFKSIVLSVEAKRQVGKSLKGLDLVRLNRLLLESAFKSSIVPVSSQRHLPRPGFFDVVYFEDVVRSLPWKQTILTAFRDKLEADSQMLYSQAAYSDGMQESINGPVFIDEMLRRLGGFMQITKIAFDSPALPYGYPLYAVGQSTFDEIVAASDGGFAAIKNQPIAALADLKKFSSKIQFPGADETNIWLDPNDDKRGYCECLFIGSRNEPKDLWLKQIGEMIKGLGNKGLTITDLEDPISGYSIQAASAQGEVRVEMRRIVDSANCRINLNFLSPTMSSLFKIDEDLFKKQLLYLIDQSRVGFSDIWGDRIGELPPRWRAKIDIPGIAELFLGNKNIFERTDESWQCYGIVDAWQTAASLKARLSALVRSIKASTPGWSYNSSAAGTRFIATETDKGPFIGLRIVPAAYVYDPLIQAQRSREALVIRFEALRKDE